MRFGKTHNLTYTGHLQQVYYNKDASDEIEISRMLDNFRNESVNKYNILPVLLYVIDYSRSSYLLMSDSLKLICNYDPRDFLDGGLALLMDVFQKDDFKIYNEQIFPANTRILQQTPQEEHNQLKFSYTFRFRDKLGKLVRVMQRGSYITSPETGLPVYSLGMITDVSMLKRDNMMLHHVEKLQMVNGYYHSQPISTNYFYPYAEDALLSRQEKVILNFLADGLSSKQIADKLFLSEHTILSHRKNMLKKTNTKNVAEMVAFAIRSAII